MLKDKRYLTHHVKGVSKNLLILDGIGDFFALETFMSNELRNNLETVYYASRTQNFIAKVWKCLPNFPKLKEHVFLWTDWNRVFCWLRKKDMLRNSKFTSINRNLNLANMREYVWADLFNFYNKKLCGESSFIKYEVENFNKIKSVLFIPDNYYCICPSTPYNQRYHKIPRKFVGNEWNSVISFLQRRNTKGVVINIGLDHIPSSHYLINLSNRTTLCQSIEVLKNSKGYIGIDSCMSVLAAKLFDNKDNNLHVKSNNDHCYRWKHVYFHPHIKFNFLKRNLLGI